MELKIAWCYFCVNQSVQWEQICSSQVRCMTRWWWSWRTRQRVRQRVVAPSTVTTMETAAVKGSVMSAISCSSWPGVTDATQTRVSQQEITILCIQLVQQSHFCPVLCYLEIRGVRLAKMTSVRFSVRFWKNCGFRFGFGFTKLTAVSVFGSVFWTVCCLVYMTLEMTYFCAELVRLIVNRSDSELEVQRHGMKNTLTVDPIMLQDELWMR